MPEIIGYADEPNCRQKMVERNGPLPPGPDSRGGRLPAVLPALAARSDDRQDSDCPPPASLLQRTGTDGPEIEPASDRLRRLAAAAATS